MRITILGAGAFGTALETILVANNHSVRFYDPKILPDLSLEDATSDAETIILAAPSSVAVDLLKQIPNKTIPLINTTKGLLSLAPFADFETYSILSGGAFAKNLKDKQPTILTATSISTADLFRTDWLKIERSKDILGVLLCGTFKNVYAIGAGEQSLTANTSAFRSYIDSSLAEIKYILAANNCNPDTANLSCGKLDLVLTCASKTSRNYQFGAELKKHNHLDLSTITATTEGLSTIQNLSSSPLKIPSGCIILSSIITKVKNATK